MCDERSVLDQRLHEVNQFCLPVAACFAQQVSGVCACGMPTASLGHREILDGLARGQRQCQSGFRIGQSQSNTQGLRVLPWIVMGPHQQGVWLRKLQHCQGVVSLQRQHMDGGVWCALEYSCSGGVILTAGSCHRCAQALLCLRVFAIQLTVTDRQVW